MHSLFPSEGNKLCIAQRPRCGEEARKTNGYTVLFPFTGDKSSKKRDSRDDNENNRY